MVVDDAEDLVQPVAVGCPHLEPGDTGVRAALADADVLDDVGAAAGQNLIEHLGQQERVDDVTLQLDFFDDVGHDAPRFRGEIRRSAGDR
jgi:hypothetical protein